MAVVVAACSSKSSGGSPPPPSLVTGTYIYSGSSLLVDSCGLGSAAGFDDFKQQLTVSPADIVFNLSSGGDPIVISSAGSFTATLTSSVDFAVSPNPLPSAIDWTSTASQLASGLPLQLTTGYRCVESVSYAITGKITGTNTFRRQTTVVHAIVQGSAAVCAGVENSEFEAVIPSFPCTATLDQEGALAP